MALSLDYFRTQIGDLVRLTPVWLLRRLTVAVWLWEGFGPILYFLPFQSTRLFAGVCIVFFRR